MLKFLEGFHQWVAQWIAWMTATLGEFREWEYDPEVAAMEAAELQPIREYIRLRQSTIAGKVACCPIYKICVEAELIPGMSRMVSWWYQDVVNEPEE